MFNSEVIIVGGGPVGIALAIELGLHNVKTLVLEHYHSPLHLPKAMGLSARSVEFFRRWGIAEELRSAIMLPKDYPYAMAWCDGLKGELFAWICYNTTEYYNKFSPESPARLPLWKTEEVLRKRLAELPSVRLLCDTEVKAVEEGVDCVTVQAYDHFEDKSVAFQAPYLVGTDGAGSVVRDAIGSQLTDHVVYSTNLKIHFYSSDLDEQITLPQAILYSVYGSGGRGTFGPIDGKGHWYAQIKCQSEEEVKAVDIPERLQKMAGFSFNCEVENFAMWTLQKAVADDFGTNRVLLAGDSAHIFTPTGGHGLNTGLGDAVNLGWKLAAHIQGWGNEPLLASYQSERKPIAQRNVVASGHNAARQKTIFEERPPQKDPEGFREALTQLARMHGEGVGIDHGYRFENSPITVKDGSMEPEDTYTEYHQVARPGHYAPHVWLEGRASLYDLFGLGFTLLVREGDSSRWEASAKDRNIPLKVVRVNDPNVSKLYKKISLIRPDWQMAWHGDKNPEDIEQIWDIVTAKQNQVVR